MSTVKPPISEGSTFEEYSMAAPSRWAAMISLRRFSCASGSGAAEVTVPGIGQAKADSIVRYREKNGAFSSIEEIKQVEGIKEGVYNRIKDNIKVK